MKGRREIKIYGQYFKEFYVEQSEAVQEKIDFVFDIIRRVDRIPTKFFEHIEGSEGLYEIRVEFESNIYRIFCCFDKGNIVVLFNAFQKKSQKTPKKELTLALRLKNEYFASQGK